jgi:uncharacterized protein (TIRG00374 family)
MRAYLRVMLVVALALALLAWFVRGADLAAVRAELARGRVDLLLLAVGMTLVTYALRSWRWQYLLAGLGPTGFMNAFRATVIGFAANFLLPARAGELIRPYVLSRHESIAASSAFATVVLERVFDMLAVLILFAGFALTAGRTFGRSDPGLFRGVQAGGVMAAVATIAVLLTFFLLSGRPEAIRRISNSVERRLPVRLAHVVDGLAERFVMGLGAVRHPKQWLVVFALSFPLWMSIACGIWLVSRAYGIDVGYFASFLVMTLLVVGVAVPTPGAIGGFHEFYRIAVTSFFGASTEKAVSAGIVLHAVSFVPVTLLGIVFMVREGLTLGSMRRLAGRPGAAEEESR